MELKPIYMMKMITQSFGLKLISQLNKQWQVCCFLLLSIGVSSAYAQNPDCLNTSSYGSAALNGTDAVVQISGCNFETEYSTISGVIAGNSYEFTSSSNGYITVREGASDGPVLAAGFSPVSVVSTDGSNLYPHWNVDETCATASSCIVTTVQCTDCPSFSCPDLQANIGDACDDGLESTYDDTLNDQCECVGIPFDCEELLANIGDACDDLDENTANDEVSENCECIGQQVVFDIDCASPLAQSFCYGNDDIFWLYNAEPGVTLNLNFTAGTIETGWDFITIYDGADNLAPVLFEGNPVDGEVSNINVNSTGSSILLVLESDGLFSCADGSGYDTWEWTVSCGVSYDCPELEANIGEACDDGLETTYDDVVTDECECAGIPFDCEELLANIGDECDDQDENTIGDQITENCECAGTPIPENDGCDSAIALECGDFVEGSNIAATPDFFCNFTDRNAVWYTLTLEESATIALTSCTSSTDFDTDISIFTGDDCENLTCFSGWGGDGYIDGLSSCEFQSWASSGEFEAEAGVTYYIAVAGYGNGEGNFGLSVECAFGVDCDELGLNIGDSCDDGDENTIDDVVSEECECVGTPVPENNECADATEISCGDVVEGSNVAASNNLGCDGDERPTVWYAFTADEDASVYLSTCHPATNIDTDINIYTGASCDDLACFEGWGGNGYVDGPSSCEFQSWASQGEFEAVEGTTYYIAVTGYGLSDVGTFGLSIECIPALDCEELQANIGDACDDGDDSTEGDIVGENCECQGVSIYDCPELEANVGDACDDGDESTENDAINENCGCEGTPIPDPNACEDWVMYLNNNAGGVTDLYGVELVGGNAELSFLTTIDYHAHIAYNPADNLVYVVSNSNASYVKVNPHVSPVEVSEVFYLAQNVPGVTTAVFGPDGDLLIGSSSQDKIYSVDVSDNSLTVYDEYAPVSGGDLAFDREGKLYLATRAGNNLYEVYPDGVWDDILIGSLANQVTGMALSGADQLILSHNGNSDLQVRDLDGSNPGDSYPLVLDGEAFDHNNGDMASGCNTFSDENEGDCEAFETFYSHFGSGTGVSGSDIYHVLYSGDEAVLSFLTNVPFGAHIAYNAEDDILYLVNPNGSFVRAYDPTLGVFIGDLPISGGINNLFAVVYNPADGLLYVGDDNDDEIYTIDLGTGQATYFADAPVSGGDLAIQDGKLYLANRGQEKLFEIVGGAAVFVADIPAGNGMAQANNATGLVLAHPGTASFIEVDAADGSEVAAYTAVLDGEELILSDGDMAAGCGDDEPVIVPEGECYAVAADEYIEGTQFNGAALPAERADANSALGEPERVDALVFTTLGYGGSITVSFGGSVPNGEGDDIEVVETSYNNPGCAAYPEYATVEVSMDGVNWATAGTVCKGDPYVDISDAGDYEYVMYVRVTNDNNQSTSSDGFDVDGIVALHNCEEDGDGGEGVEDLLSVDSQNQLTSFPNPTNGPSQVVFVTAETGRTLVEVYDMNGRMVEALFNQEAEAGVEYRLDFNGNNLPNGVYIYRMTTENEVIVDKFMIAR